MKNKKQITTMKKTVKNVLVLALATATSAFNNPPTEKMEVSTGTIIWVGKKVTGKHTGTIELKEGHFQMEGENIVGGHFVIDMKTITVTDLTGEYKGKLEGHLHSDDFFGTDNFGTATLDVTKAKKNGNTYSMDGNITIKGITQPIAFDLVMNGNEATTHLTIDRTKFGVRYGSGSFFDNLGDSTIYDNFDLDINLKF
jgi:polyisoprenoid-binding protein YceI